MILHDLRIVEISLLDKDEDDKRYDTFTMTAPAMMRHAAETPTINDTDGYDTAYTVR